MNDAPRPAAATRWKHGVRVVAAFEAGKGVLVLIAGFGMLEAVHGRAQSIAEAFVARLHLNPANEYPRIFLQLAQSLSDDKLRWLAAFAALYAAVRFTEAYGLWLGRRWAEWFAAVSGGIYVPLELYELARGVTWIKLVALAVNVGIVVYMAYTLAQARRSDTVY